MNKKTIFKLAKESYIGENLDPKKVNKISVLLSKSDLKKYIGILKTIEKKKTLIVSIPKADKNQTQDKLKKIFPNKKMIFKEDPNLLLGIQIVDYDMVYDFTLKNSLDNIILNLEKNYD